jgi:hypothetical protein
MQTKLLGIVSVDFYVINQLFIIYNLYSSYTKKKWEYNGTVHQLFIDLEKGCDSVRSNVQYSH